MLFCQRQWVLSKYVECLIVVIVIRYGDTAWVCPRIVFFCSRNSSVVVEVTYVLARVSAVEVPCIVSIDHETLDRSDAYGTSHPQVVLAILGVTTLLHDSDRVGVATLTCIVSIRMLYWHQWTQVVLHLTRVCAQTWVSSRVHSCSTTGRVKLWCIGMSNLSAYIQPLGNVRRDVYVSVVLLVLIVASGQDTLLVVHTERCIVGSTVVTAADAGIVDLREWSLVKLIPPVGIAAIAILSCIIILIEEYRLLPSTVEILLCILINLILELMTRTTIISIRLVHHGEVLHRVYVVVWLGRALPVTCSVERDGWFVALATLLGSNEDYTVCCTCTIDGCRRSILQNRDRLNVFWIHEVGIHLNVINQYQWATAVQRRVTTDIVARAGTRSTTTVHRYVQVRNNTLKTLSDVGDRTVFQYLTIHVGNSTREVYLLLCTITYDNDFFQAVSILSKSNVEAFSVPLDFTVHATNIRDNDCCTLAYTRKGKIAVQIGNGSILGTFHWYRSTNNRFTGSILYHTLTNSTLLCNHSCTQCVWGRNSTRIGATY